MSSVFLLSALHAVITVERGEVVDKRITVEPGEEMTAEQILLFLRAGVRPSEITRREPA